MALPRTHRPPIADTGGRRQPSLFLRAAAAAAPTAAATGDHNSYPSHSRKHRPRPFTDADVGLAPPAKRQKPSAAATLAYDAGQRRQHAAPSTGSSASFPPPIRHAATASAARSEEDAAAFMSRDEIERCSPSRKDGIDQILETNLRYSYCAYLQTLGMRLQLPPTTVGTAMVLCHRFFFRRSHACHDRFLIATAALFLASKLEETPCLLNTVLRTSCEICQTQDFSFYPYFLYSQDWFEQYRERVTEAEQMILTTLDFELDVHHPYIPLTSVLNKLGLSQTALLNLAWNLVSEGSSPCFTLSRMPQDKQLLCLQSLNGMDIFKLNNMRSLDGARWMIGGQI